MKIGLLFNHGFILPCSICNGCCDLSMWSVIISAITVVTIKGVDYGCIIHGICKFKAINLLQNSELDDRGAYIKCIPKKSILKIESTITWKFNQTKKLKTTNIFIDKKSYIN